MPKGKYLTRWRQAQAGGSHTFKASELALLVSWELQFPKNEEHQRVAEENAKAGCDRKLATAEEQPVYAQAGRDRKPATAEEQFFHAQAGSDRKPATAEEQLVYAQAGSDRKPATAEAVS